MLGDYPITWLICEILTVVLTVLCMYRALKQENYKTELFRFLMFIIGAAIFENIGVLYVKMYNYDLRRLMMFGVVPLSVLLLEADILYVASILFEKLRLPKWTCIWVIGFFCAFMDFSIDPVFISDSYSLNGAMSGQWNWTYHYDSQYYGIPYMNFSGWLYMTGLYPAIVYLMNWISKKLKKPVLEKIAPFIAGILLIVPIALCQPLMYTGEESSELIKLLINCLVGIIFLVLFRKRRGNISFKEEPLLVIVPACIYVYSLAVIFARSLYECLSVVLICVAFHAAYYILLGYSSKRKPECIEMVSKGK